MEAAVRTSGLRKELRGTVVLHGPDLAVPTGSVLGHRGPNGAGGTATIRLPTGLLRPTYVAGLLEGVDPWPHLSPMERAPASGPHGGGPPDLAWLALGCVVVTPATLPTLDRRDIAVPG